MSSWSEQGHDLVVDQQQDIQKILQTNPNKSVSGHIEPDIALKFILR